MAEEEDGGRISVLPDEEKAEAEKIYEKWGAENLETAKTFVKGLLDIIERENASFVLLVILTIAIVVP